MSIKTKSSRLPSDEAVKAAIAELVSMINSPDEGREAVMKVNEDKRRAETPTFEGESIVNPTVEEMVGEEPFTKSETVLAEEAEKSYKSTTRDAKDTKEKFETTEEKRPVTPTDVEHTMDTKPEEIPIESASDAEIMDNIEKLFKSGIITTPVNKKMKKLTEEAAKKPAKIVAPIDYQKDTMSICGKSIPFKRAVQKANWGNDFDPTDSYGNLIKLKKYITSDIMKQFGDWTRIRSIHVYSEQLIVNGICYIPQINPAFKDSFPLDAVDYISNGTLAPLFDWSKLRKMSNLIELHIDSCQFYVINICDDLGWHKDATALFKICSSLKVLSVDGELIGEDTRTTEATAKHKKKSSFMQYMRMIPNGYKLDVCKGTQSLQDWSFKNLKDFANKRGDKGIFAYALGLTGRTLGVVASGTVNLGTHLVGGLGKAIWSAAKNAVTPVDKSDL